MAFEKYLKIFKECQSTNIQKEILINNIRKGRIFAYITIVFDLLLAAVDISSSILEIDDRFHYSNYLIAYLIFISINIIFLLIISRIKYSDIENSDPNRIKRFEGLIIVYITLIMSWGSIISLMDQKLYGQLMAFMVNAITCSVIYLLDNKKIMIPYIISISILCIGLPFFQSSSDVLVGHYVNLFVFISISWLTSRIVYIGYCHDINNKKLLKESKALLENQIDENKQINLKLTMANNQLKELALIDELTGIPNRRNFRNFIDLAFTSYVKSDTSFSFMMIDIDFFKEFNDTYGHIEGDKVLVSVANTINSVVKNPMELVARWGGEEFVYVSFNMSKKYIVELAEEIRLKILSLEIYHNDSVINNFLSVSIGVCFTKVHSISDVSRIIEQADKMLYSAKEKGRNNVQIYIE
jgi:diguanylate cyclase (GGDEF)-like protein